MPVTQVDSGRTEHDAALDDAVRVFADAGFGGTTLEHVAAEAGLDAEALRSLASDTAGLYDLALARALAQITPPREVLERSHAVPVEGMRRFVDSLFHAFLDHPDAVRLLLRENLDRHVDVAELTADHRDNDVALHVERLLMVGQDAGAFRPGINADDVLALIVSLCEFQVAHASSAYAISRVNFTDQRNTDGMRRMVIDAVLAFLTSNIPHSGYDSYLVAEEPPAAPGEPEIYPG